jgi:carbon storage regulator
MAQVLQQQSPVMFIVARRKGQRIVIGNEIEIVVTELSRTTVKLGIIAPKPYTILRGEILEQIEQTNREALRTLTNNNTGEQLPAQSPPTVEVTLATANEFLGRSVKSTAPTDVNNKTVD